MITQITGPLRSRINRLAHARAQRFALTETARLTQELLALANTGADLDKLNSRLDAMEKTI